ncbi:MAG: GNAT family protein [Christiangramia sp.]|nr:GNAT family protein [Christiangramia sp.]
MEEALELSVREIEKKDIDLITDYWLNADPEFLKGMGVDLQKLPSRSSFKDMLTRQIETPYQEKKSYALIWLANDIEVGHSNVNEIEYGKQAKMHLHLWNSGQRKKGLGSELLAKTLPLYFRNLKLEVLWCEPYAKNPAPNRTLDRAGFEFVKRYITVPGSLNFEQEVNRWKLTREKFNGLELN